MTAQTDLAYNLSTRPFEGQPVSEEAELADEIRLCIHGS